MICSGENRFLLLSNSFQLPKSYRREWKDIRGVRSEGAPQTLSPDKAERTNLTTECGRTVSARHTLRYVRCQVHYLTS